MSEAAKGVQAIEDARRAGDLALARDLLRSAAKDTGGMDAHLTHQHALIEMASGRHQEARDAFLLLAQQVPAGALLWFNAGRCSEILGEYEAAKHLFRSAIDAHRTKLGQPDEARSYFGMGGCLFRLGDSVNGEAFWRQGLEKPCDSPYAIYERAQVKFALGQYTEDAWQDYEARKSHYGYQRSIQARTQGLVLPPEWDWKAKERVLCVGGQGAGDVIMFSRYLSIVEERTGRQPVLLGGDVLMPFLGYDGDPKTCTSHVMLDSLPLVFGMYEPIPPEETLATHAYRYNGRTISGLSAIWQRGTNPRVGYCFRGATGHLNDKDRSCAIWPVAAFDAKWELVSLEHGAGLDAKHYGETADLMRTLDAVVCVDTSTTHLAGTLGVPTILIPPSCPEWRWGLPSVARSPWYPSIEIVRRKNVSDWSGALTRAQAKLTEMLA